MSSSLWGDNLADESEIQFADSTDDPSTPGSVYQAIFDQWLDLGNDLLQFKEPDAMAAEPEATG